MVLLVTSCMVTDGWWQLSSHHTGPHRRGQLRARRTYVWETEVESKQPATARAGPQMAGHVVEVSPCGRVRSRDKSNGEAQGSPGRKGELALGPWKARFRVVHVVPCTSVLPLNHHASTPFGRQRTTFLFHFHFPQLDLA